MDSRETLLEVKNIKKYFKGHARGKPVKAVDDVSFSIARGETLGLVGESGCGKSTLGRTVLNLIRATEGQVLYAGKDLTKLPEHEMRQMRQKLQMVFQNPYSSLNPRMTVLEAVRAPLDIFNIGTKEERFERSREILKYVGMDEYQIYRYPHEFSGGQRQRVIIALALATRPELLFCDEAVSALDVSVRAQILNLLQDLQDELKLTYLFCSHDLSVIEHICDRVAIMYLGKIVEIGTREDIFKHPKHPYTKALLSAIPMVGKKKERILLNGDIPSPVNPPSGCRFRTRCPYATDRCRQEAPELLCVSGEHKVACFLLEKPEPEQP